MIFGHHQTTFRVELFSAILFFSTMSQHLLTETVTSKSVHLFSIASVYLSFPLKYCEKLKGVVKLVDCLVETSLFKYGSRSIHTQIPLFRLYTLTLECVERKHWKHTHIHLFVFVLNRLSVSFPLSRSLL